MAWLIMIVVWIVTLPLWLPLAIYLRLTGKRIRFDH